MKNNERSSPALIKDETEMFRFAATFVQHIKPGDVVFLEGTLGAGKTTFVRGFLRALGYNGIVKSPTYTLVETYSLDNHPTIHHFDLYRLKSPLELDHLGPDYYFTKKAICFIEWPEKATKLLPQPTLQISIDIKGHHRLASQIKS